MPLVKRMQQEYGKDKFDVVLLSVDASHHFGDPAEEDRKSLEEVGVDWDNVLVPDGFNTLLKRYNLDGYGSTLIDPDGNVQGVDLRANEVKEIISGQK